MERYETKSVAEEFKDLVRAARIDLKKQVSPTKID